MEKYTLRLAEVLFNLSKLAVVATLFLSLMLFFGGKLYILELLSHFRLQLFAVSILTFLILLIERKKIFLSLASVSLLINSIYILPWYISNTNKTQALNVHSSIKIIHSNVYTANENVIGFTDFINKEAPDIVVLQEVNQRWEQGLKSLKALYPYHIFSTREDNFGIALLSKLPLQQPEVRYWEDEGIPSIETLIHMNDKVIRLITTHPLPPINGEYFSSRNKQLLHIAKHIQKKPDSTILIGDLNVSMWSDYYLELENLSGLKNTRKGFGILPSWPSKVPILKIPIDHCLVGSNFSIVSTRLGENTGSDHLPLIVELKI